jgi:RES domain-containing protein
MPELRAFFPFRANPSIHRYRLPHLPRAIQRKCGFHARVLAARSAVQHSRLLRSALHTSLSKETARREMARYFTVPPIGGFVEASIDLQLNRVLDLTDRKLLRRVKITWNQLVQAGFYATQEIGLRAWEGGMEALLVPSAADPAERNLAVFLDNQRPQWRVHLTKVAVQPG